MSDDDDMMDVVCACFVNNPPLESSCIAIDAFERRARFNEMDGERERAGGATCIYRPQ